MTTLSLKPLKDFTICVVLWIPGIIGLLFLLILLLYRLTVHFLAWIFRPDLIPVYNPVDNATIIKPSKQYPCMNTSTTIILRGKLDIKIFREHFERVLLSSKDLRQRYVNLYCYFVSWGGYMFKKPVKEIDLNERIREVTLEVKNTSEVEVFIGEYVELNDYGKNPNWEILLIHVKTSDTIDDQGYIKCSERQEAVIKTWLVFKIDHGLCDGYSLMHLTDKLCAIESAYQVKLVEFTTFEKICMVWNLFLYSLKLYTSLVKCGNMPWTKVSDGKREEMHLCFTALDLERFKRVRRQAGCHFTTLVAVVEAEACRRFFVDKRPGSILPEYNWVWAPWGQPLHPAMHGGPLVNHFTISTLRVGMRESDLVAKIREAEAHYIKMNEYRKYNEHMYRVFIPLSWPVPFYVQRLMRKLIIQMGLGSKLGTIISPNVRSSEEYNLLGVSVDKLYQYARVSTILDTTRVQMFASSNGGFVNIAIGGRKDTFKDKQEFEYLARRLVKETFHDIEGALEKNEKQHVKIKCEVQWQHPH